MLLFPLLAREKNVSFSLANCFAESYRGSQEMNTGGGRVWEKVGDCHCGINEERHKNSLKTEQLFLVNISRFSYLSFGMLNTTIY